MKQRLISIGIFIFASSLPTLAAAQLSDPVAEMKKSQGLMFQASSLAGQVSASHRMDFIVWANLYSQKVVADCAKDAPRSNAEEWFNAHPAAMRCMSEEFQSRTAALERFVAQAKAGPVSDEAIKELEVSRSNGPPPSSQSAPVKAEAPAPATINPLNGTGAKLVHDPSGSLLEYTDGGGAKHRVAVARPKLLKDIPGDFGNWLYVAPDKKSGTLFQLGPDGSVHGDPVNPAKLPFLAGS